MIACERKVSLSFLKLLVAGIVAWSPAVEAPGQTGGGVKQIRVAMAPFRDLTRIEHKIWRLGMDLPNALADTLSELASVSVLRPAVVRNWALEQGVPATELTDRAALRRLANELGVDVAVGGEVVLVNVERLNVGTALIGGYESYKADVAFRWWAYLRDRDAYTPEEISEGEVVTKDLGLTLFGKASKLELEYRSLDTLAFGSPAFMATMLGEAFAKARRKFVSRFTNLLGLEAKQPKSYLEAKILYVQGKNVYLNVGRLDGVSAGLHCLVVEEGEPILDPDSGELVGYADEPVGRVRIVYVKDDHLSLAELVSSSRTLRTGDRVLVPKIE